ncbi:hypothetical protein HJFPF1_11146 [Paramyrothecium foliicola]|nr:hypothetical protein HJFPF1_11146 [Paramyrothecium foliicola]
MGAIFDLLKANDQMDTLTSQSSLACFSPEIHYNILSYLDQKTLKGCRLLNRYYGNIATAHAFLYIRLARVDDVSSTRFISVAKSIKLRRIVRRVICDTSSRTFVEEMEGRQEKDQLDSLESYEHLMRALSYLRLFVNLSHLQIHLDDQPTEAPNVKYAVVATAFHCVFGCWTTKRQRRMETQAGFKFNTAVHAQWDWVDDFKSLSDHGALAAYIPGKVPSKTCDYKNSSIAGFEAMLLEVHYDHEEEEEEEEEEEVEEEEEEEEEEEVDKIELQSFTVTNLGDYVDARLEKSEAFRIVMAMPWRDHAQTSRSRDPTNGEELDIDMTCIDGESSSTQQYLLPRPTVGDVEMMELTS